MGGDIIGKYNASLLLFYNAIILYLGVLYGGFKIVYEQTTIIYANDANVLIIMGLHLILIYLILYVWLCRVPSSPGSGVI